MKTELVKEAGVLYTVREAKARLSEVIQLAGEGTEVIITAHGHPKVRVGPAERGRGKPFHVDFEWLRRRTAARAKEAADVIRADRDARG